jgi:DnaJ-class molecular chaperone
MLNEEWAATYVMCDDCEGSGLMWQGHGGNEVDCLCVTCGGSGEVAL